LIRGLPEDALLARPMGQGEAWTRTHELLASVVEVVSVSAADRRLKKPLQVPRPKPARPSRANRPAVERAKGAVPLGEAMTRLDNGAGRVRVVHRGGPS
jgi:hypothetical protein